MSVHTSNTSQFFRPATHAQMVGGSAWSQRVFSLESTESASLVPRPFCGGGEDGRYGLSAHARTIPQDSWGFGFLRILSVLLSRYTSRTRLFIAESANVNNIPNRRLVFALKSVGKGHLTLKKEQLSALRHAYDGEDVFVWLPTGFGKSIVYECLPFLFDHKLDRLRACSCNVVLVVSPLVALMIDQVESLRKRGVDRAVMSDREGVDKGLLVSEKHISQYHLLFCAPEAVILVERWRQLLSDSPLHFRIVAIAVDEAHCVSKW